MRVFAICVAAVVTSSLPGCGGNGDNATREQPQVDPRFASAEALLEYYNQVALRQPKTEPRQVFSLLFAETPLQERLVKLYKASLPLMELDDLCWERYGKGLGPDEKESPFAPARERAIMVEVGDERAKARHRKNDGREIVLYLVNYNRRWWISGYTLEYDPDINPADRDLGKAARAIGYLAAVAPKVTAELKSGKWADAGEYGPELVHLRLMAYVLTDFPETRNMPDLFEN